MPLLTESPLQAPAERPPRVAAAALAAHVATPRGPARCGVRNLSLSGLFLEGLSAPMGHEVELALALPGEEAPLRVRGRVVRADATGAGLVFSRIGWEDLLAIARFQAPRL